MRHRRHLAAVRGVGLTRFGIWTERSLLDLLAEAALRALEDADMARSSVDAVYVASMGAGMLQGQAGLSSLLVDRLSLFPAAADLVENGSASGASAVKNGVLAIASGLFETVLVVGGKKMHQPERWQSTDFAARATHPEVEYPYGITMPGLAGMFGRLFMEKYGLTREHLVAVAVKNQEMGARNPFAHLTRVVTRADLLVQDTSPVNNPLVADPLRLYDACPVSDGAAALVLTRAEIAREGPHPAVIVSGLGHATDLQALQERPDPTELRAVRLASHQAFAGAAIRPTDVDVAELHDAFTILEIAESEEVGFFAPGQGGPAALASDTGLDGRPAINISGGLKARGHPLGATGVAQVVELVYQLRHGLPSNRQVVEAHTGFSLNMGGLGNNVVAFVLQRREDV